MSEEQDSSKKEPLKSLVASSIKERIEDEKCVVAQYRTNTKQKNAFVQHLSTCRKNSIPIEWVIDIADESNGWFYGTGYHYDDTTQMLHVMVPDKENPTFDGQVLLDHRTVHLIECVDGRTDALFNKIVRDSVIKVKWDVEWFEESEDGAGESPSWAADGTTGTWIHSSARYYIRIANQLLVEDKDLGQESRGFVIITADLNLKLLKCHKGKGLDDFQRLINEGVVQSSPEAAEVARAAAAASPAGTPVQGASSHHSHAHHHSHSSDATPGGGSNAAGADGAAAHTPAKGAGPSSSSSLQADLDTSTNTHTNTELMNSPLPGTALTPAGKLADMSTGLRECVVDILDDRDRMKAESAQLADLFHTFSLEGDLDAGLRLMEHFEGVRAKAEKLREAQALDLPLEDADDKIEAIADDAVYLAQKLERNLAKIVRNGGEISTNAEEEIETLRKSLRKARIDLQDRDDELNKFKGVKA